MTDTAKTTRKRTAAAKKPAAKAAASASPATSKPVAAKKVAAKTLPKQTTQPAAAQPAAPAPVPPPVGIVKKTLIVVNEDERYRMVAEAAYYRAENCQFQSDPVSDWIEAEKEIAALLGKG